VPSPAPMRATRLTQASRQSRSQRAERVAPPLLAIHTTWPSIHCLCDTPRGSSAVSVTKDRGVGASLAARSAAAAASGPAATTAVTRDRVSRARRPCCAPVAVERCKHTRGCPAAVQSFHTHCVLSCAWCSDHAPHSFIQSYYILVCRDLKENELQSQSHDEYSIEPSTPTVKDNR
jgi:hypothetical protein